MLFSIDLVEKDKKQRASELFELYHKELLKITAGKLKTAGDTNYIDDAQDVVQNVYVKVIKYADAVSRIDESGIRGYLYAVASNETANFLSRRSGHHNRTELRDESCHTEDDCLDGLLVRERYDRVVACIMALDEKYSIVMLFRYAQGYSVSRIARILGISKKQVYSRLNTGRRKLIEMLDGEEQYE